MDSLISRQAAIEAVKVSDGGCNNPSERIGIIFARVEARRAIQSIPSVPAIPLDNLCELLSHCTFPCNLLYLRCPYDECNKTTEFRKESEECWKAVLTKWMEAQDAR